MSTAESERIDFLAALWRRFADLEAGTYSPLYRAIALAVAEERDLLARVIADTPGEAHHTINLLAAVHDVVLRGTDHPLAAIYTAGTVTDDAPAHFIDFCAEQWAAIADTMQYRRVQTNETGRSAAIALALALIAADHGPITGLVELGASAGLNLRFDRYRLDYGALGTRGDPASPVHVPCTVSAPGFTLPGLPEIGIRLGLDRSPIDVTAEDDRRWLRACVWPDTGRLARTTAALDLATADPPTVMQGDMVTGVAGAVGRVGGDGLVCVMTTWAASYLTGEQRKTLAEHLDALGRSRPIVWLSLEPPNVVRGVDPMPDPGTFDIEPCVIGTIRFDGGQRTGTTIGLVHPHGKAVALAPR